jgi:hypothetical protein
MFKRGLGTKARQHRSGHLIFGGMGVFTTAIAATQAPRTHIARWARRNLNKASRVKYAWFLPFSYVAAAHIPC